MTAAGTTSDLYVEDDQGNKQVMTAPPPSAPAPVPEPTKPAEQQTVLVKHRMADEGPDGKVRDTSTEALRPGNDLNFRNLDDEQLTQKPPEPKPEDAKPPETKPAEAPQTPEAKPPEKLYAGKYKSPEELEKAYEESQRAMHRAFEEKATLERQATARTVAPPTLSAKTPEQAAAEQQEAARLVNEFVQDPKGFVEKNIVQRVMVALASQQMTEKWRTANPDLVEHEARVAFEAAQLVQSDPKLAEEPSALFDRATARFREFTGKLRTEGAKEALTQETRVIPLASSSTTPSATEHPPQKAPLTADQAYEAHLQMLKEQEKRSHRGLRR